jgi:hypothetical protein
MPESCQPSVSWLETGLSNCLGHCLNASVMSESSDSSDASSEPCLRCGERCGYLGFCRRTPVNVKQRRQWHQWSRSPDQQPLWMFMCFLKEHEKPGLYNVIRQDLMWFSGRPQPLLIVDETPSQSASSEDRMLRDAENWAAEQDTENSDSPFWFDQDNLGIPVVNNSSGEQSAMH